MQRVTHDVRTFFLRGNVAGLTVAVAIGYAFVTLAQTFVDGLVMPVLLGVLGTAPFEGLTFTVGDNDVYYGFLVGALVVFALVAVAAYLLVIVPVNAFVARRRAEDEPLPATRS